MHNTSTERLISFITTVVISGIIPESFKFWSLNICNITRRGTDTGLQVMWRAKSTMCAKSFIVPNLRSNT